MILMKIPWNKQLYLTVLLMLSFVSCQTKKLYFSAYKDLPLEEKQEVNTYLAEVKQAYPKNDNEIILMLSYECFLKQSVIINKKIQKEFPEVKNGSHYGKTLIITIGKALNKNIELEFSNGNTIKISPKEKYDYISVCYGKDSKEWYIEYYDYPHLNFSE